ncbi:MAG: chromosome segregation ATPase [Cyanobacteria bacterium P01_D01_bin.156]
MSPQRPSRRHSKSVHVPRSHRSQPEPSGGGGKRSVPSPSYAGVATDVPSAQPAAKPSRKFPGLAALRWMGSWQFLLLATVVILTGTVSLAVSSLFRMPNLPNCRGVFWPTASAAMRLQCAESYAAQDSVDFLLEAINLVEKLPDDHPLRAEINAKVERWSIKILELADDQFHQGDLDGAIATAQKIPLHTAAADDVETSVNRWRRVWEEGSDIFEQAKTQLVEGNFKDAFGLSVRLLDVSNDHWSETKYGELTGLIAMAREDSRKLGKVRRLARAGTVKGFKEALKLINSISSESVLYEDAQTSKSDISRDMLRVAERFLARKQLPQAEEILVAIPRNEGLDAEIADFQVFIDAYRRAWSGDALGLDSAITRLQSMGRDRPLYGRAQELISQWRAEIQALAQLDVARQIAAPGNLNDLRSAIVQARQIDRGNPRWDEVSNQIDQWETRVETTEDLPILNRADQLAAAGTPQGLQLAIREAQRIRSDRALSDRAKERIGGWQGQLEAIEDRPLLDEARRRAAAGDLGGAIAVASRISPERSLYSEIQDELGSWRDQQQNTTRLQEANNIARSGTANDLARAIVTANQIPDNSSQYKNALTQINDWSWNLLNLAESESSISLERAISLAGQIPSQAAAYANAQDRIRDWQRMQGANTLELTAPDDSDI